jgi:large subunit ribosomal protein L19e
MDCGKRKVWLDPNEMNEISNANSRTLLLRLLFHSPTTAVIIG